MLSRRFLQITLPRAILPQSCRPMSTTADKWKEKNEKSGRPVSPHVLIYKFPIAAITSIANRGTGLALSGGL